VDPRDRRIRELRRMVAELQEEKERLRELAFRDLLTGLATRTLLEEQLHVWLADRQRVSAVFLFLDINDFKTINDRGGHPEGDRILTTVGKAVAGAIRASDLAARMSGGSDEIAVLLKDCDFEKVQFVLARLCEAFSEISYTTTYRQIIPVGVSFGGVLVTPQHKDFNTILTAADRNLYAAKAKKTQERFPVVLGETE